MEAKDVMTRDVVTVGPDTPVQEIAATLLDRRISAVPVVDGGNRLLGIVSEGDLMRRAETGTERHASWWLAMLTLPETDARRFVKTHGRFARDVMTRDVVSVPEDCPLREVAEVLENHRIKRVPVLRDGTLVGIVSRADLLRGLAAIERPPAPSADDRVLREAVEKAIRDKVSDPTAFISATVNQGVVRLWGAVGERYSKDMARVAAENVPGVRAVEDHISLFAPDVRALMWAQ